MRTKSSNFLRPHQDAGTRAMLLVSLALIIGFAGGALVVYRATKSPGPAPVGESKPLLSESTRTVISHLQAPVEIHFYALFGGDQPPARLREFAGRANDLLAALEAGAPGKITVVRYETWNPANTKNAAADGVAVMDFGGDPNYLGIAVAQAKRKETLARLDPEWAPALEFDLARAISKVGAAPVAPRSAEEVVQTGKAEEAVKRTIADAAATSLEDGKQLLRDASLKTYQTLIGEMNGEVAKAEQLVQQATDADREAALEKLQQIRAAYVEKLRGVALQSQAELEAWMKLKGP